MNLTRSISIADFTSRYAALHSSHRVGDIIRRLNMALEDYHQGIKCICGNDLWVLGSAFEGNTCFKCMMGRELTAADVEIEGALEKADKPIEKLEVEEPFVPEYWGYYHDDGTPWNPDLHPKPALCLSCRKNDNARHEILCNLSRLGQSADEEFVCNAHVGLADNGCDGDETP